MSWVTFHIPVYTCARAHPISVSQKRLMVDAHWRPAVRSPVQYGPGRLVSPSGTDMKLVNGPGSGVNARRPARVPDPCLTPAVHSSRPGRGTSTKAHTNGWTPASRLRRSASV